MMRRWSWLLSILFGLICIASVALFFWPLPTLAECTEVTGRVSVVYSDDVGTGRPGRTNERLNFKLDSSERYFTYEETDPSYSEVKSRVRVRAEARIWHKDPPVFIFPLYSKELWRIDVGGETIVDYDTLAADAGRAKGVIALVGLGFFGLLTFVTLGVTLRGVKRRT
jgi:hypothetical protein